MLDTASSNYRPEFDQYPTEDLDARFILRQCSSLPRNVRTAEIAKSFERVLDDEELQRITNPDFLEKPDFEALERLRVRQEALQKHLGDFLVGLVIQLPGARYTIEIDAISQSVVHWEWQ